MSRRQIKLGASALATVVLGSTVAVANETHNRLMQMPEASQTTALAAVVRSSGSACTGRGNEFKGVERTSGKAFWRVDCREGSSYMVQINNDSGGSTRVLSCNIATKCFGAW